MNKFRLVTTLSLSVIAISSCLLATSCKHEDKTPPNPELLIDGNKNLSGFEQTASNENYSYVAELKNSNATDINYTWSLTSKDGDSLSPFFHLDDNDNVATLSWTSAIVVNSYHLTLKVTAINLISSCDININIASLPQPSIYGDENIDAYKGIVNSDLTWYSSNINVNWSLQENSISWISISTYGQLSITDTSSATIGNYNIVVKATSTLDVTKTSIKNVTIHLNALPEVGNAVVKGWTDLYGAKTTASTNLCQGIYEYEILSPQYNTGDVVWQLGRSDSGNLVFWNQATGWDDTYKTGYEWIVPQVINNKLYVGWDSTITKNPGSKIYTFRVALRSTPSYSGLWYKDITFNCMDEFDGVDNVDIDCVGHLGDFSIPITEGVASNRQYKADVTQTILGVHTEDDINQNVTWTLEGNNIPSWLQIDSYSGLLSWSDQAIQCEDDSHPYNVQIKATSRQDITKSYTKTLNLKISSGNKLSLLQKTIDYFNQWKDNLLNWLNILKNLTGPINATVQTAILNCDSIVIQIMQLGALIYVSQQTFGTISNSEALMIKNKALSLSNECSDKTSLLSNLMVLATSNGKYIQTNPISPNVRYANDVKLTQTAANLSEKAYIIGNFLGSTLGVPFFQSTAIGGGFVIEASIECAYLLTKASGAAANIWSIG